MYHLGNMDICQIHVGKTANNHILQFNIFSSNMFKACTKPHCMWYETVVYAAPVV